MAHLGEALLWIGLFIGGAAIAMAALQEHELRFAKWLFWLFGLLVGSGYMISQAHWHESIVIRIVTASIVGAFVFGGTAGGLAWVSKKQKALGDTEMPSGPFPGKGGDAHGPGGAGGGAVGGGSGGDAYGSGGAGGGGSVLGGGGGGGGEGAPGGEGGIGGGGGGGGKGAPGGKGGPGAIIISYAPLKTAPPPKTLYQLFQLDAYNLGFVGITHAKSQSIDGPLDIEVNVSWGLNCGPMSIWFYVPPITHPAKAIQELKYIYRRAIVMLDMQTQMPSQAGCAAIPSSTANERFSGKIYVYSQTPLKKRDQHIIADLFERDGAKIEIRSLDYFSREMARRARHPASSPDEVVIMMVGREEKVATP